MRIEAAALQETIVLSAQRLCFEYGRAMLGGNGQRATIRYFGVRAGRIRVRQLHHY